MTGMRRHFGLLALFTVLCLPAGATTSAIPYVAQDTFQEGVQLLNDGDDAGALEKFTEVLASDMSNEAAYELWKSTEYEVWLQLLVKGGQYELVAKRLMSKAQLGRVEQSDDEEAIRGLLREVQSEDVIARAGAIRSLSANHGEYAVQYMLQTLGDENAGDRRVLFMQALTEMGTDVVLPLVTALRSDDAYLRRNVALTLGYIGDPRAAAALTWLANEDQDAGVRQAAAGAAAKVGSTGDALALCLQLGDDYYNRRATVLRAVDYSAVVWSWDGEALASTPVPRFMYATELSKNAYFDALSVDPTCLDARAGLARAYVAQQAEIALRVEHGLDVAGLDEQVATAAIAVNTTGVDALNQALAWAVRDQDTATGIGLIRILGQNASTAVPTLNSALASSDAALSGEAAVALGQIAFRSRSAALPSVVSGLGEAAGRSVMRLGVVIDANIGRGQAIAEAMRAEEMVVNVWDRGTLGLSLLKRAPGIDVIVLAGELPTLTADQMLDELSRDDRTASIPVVMITESEDYADRVSATIASAADIGTITEAMAESLDGDRARADDLAARAASTLANLALAGSDISGALEALTGTLGARRDLVTVPAAVALGTVGGSGHVATLMGVLADEERSEEARVAAADAISQIAARDGLSGPEALLTALGEVIQSDAGLGVRVAASRALSNMAIADDVRAVITKAARVNLEQ